MAFQKFKEYLSDKGTLQQKPTISVDGDTGPVGKKSSKPGKAVVKGKNWHNVEAAQVNDGADGTKPEPYSAPGTDPGQETADGKAGRANPLGQKGDRNLIYNPKTTDQRLKMKKMHDTTPEDTKTEEFLNKTRGLSPEQYAEYILSKNNANSIKQVIETVDTIKNNEVLIETLVREIKRKGGLHYLVEAILDQPETYGEIAAKLANESKGKNVARQLAKAINEITAEPASDDIPEKPASKKMPPKDDSINSRGQPVPPEMNSRKKQYVMMQPEHNLIEALANYKSIRTAMKNLVS